MSLIHMQYEIESRINNFLHKCKWRRQGMMTWNMWYVLLVHTHTLGKKENFFFKKSTYFFKNQLIQKRYYA